MLYEVTAIKMMIVCTSIVTLVTRNDLAVRFGDIYHPPESQGSREYVHVCPPACVLLPVKMAYMVASRCEVRISV